MYSSYTMFAAALYPSYTMFAYACQPAPPLYLLQEEHLLAMSLAEVFLIMMLLQPQDPTFCALISRCMQPSFARTRRHSPKDAPVGPRPHSVGTFPPGGRCRAPSTGTYRGCRYPPVVAGILQKEGLLTTSLPDNW